MISINRTIDIRNLRVYVEVARTGGVTAAATALGIAKSAASKDLTTLEASLKVRLFERSSRRVSLTKEGLMLLPRAQSILAEIDQLVEDALEEKKQVSGVVRVAASPEFGAFLAERFLPLLLAQYPALKVLMRLEYQLDDLHDPSIDLAFRLGSVGDDRLVARRIGEFSRHVVCSPGYAHAHTVTKPEELSNLDALLFTDTDLHGQWDLMRCDGLGATVKVPVRGKLSIRGFNALLGAAKTGLGIARLPSFVAAHALAQGSLVDVLSDWQATPSGIYVAYRTSVMRIGRVRAVIDAAAFEIPRLLLAGSYRLR
jgi:DNA-binding transcriptional LysR family regulator